MRSIIGFTPYLATIIDHELLDTCNDLDTQHAIETENTLDLWKFILDYVATNENPSIMHYKYDMQWWVVSHASRLSFI